MRIVLSWFIGLVALAAVVANANNMRVDNVGVTGFDSVARRIEVVCDITWDNSWRGADNWDAAWVFVKFRAPGANEWQHARLASSSALHHADGAAIDATTDGGGVFLYSAVTQTGSVKYASTRLCWEYGSNNYNFAVSDSLDIAVQAIEMVYIPEGAFYLGSGGNENGHFYRYSDGSQSTNAYLVSSEDTITVGTGSGNLRYAGGGMLGDGAGPVPAAFPKGYAAFYCMKYELTQGQYASFLNKLTQTQFNNRNFNAVSGTARLSMSGVWKTTVSGTPDRACNEISWVDGCAYTAWAGLRPMTELEYEKACRGPAAPVPNEYAWGTTSLTRFLTESGASGSGTEVVGTLAGANSSYDDAASMPGPTRAGIFAASGAGARQEAGAGYHGVLELSGNLRERVITVGSSQGRQFLGTHGNGMLSASGEATNADWTPSDAKAAGFRGGSWKHPATVQRVSDRTYAAQLHAGRSGPAQGFRAVRSASTIAP